MRYIWIQGQVAEVLTALTCTKEVFCPNTCHDTQHSWNFWVVPPSRSQENVMKEATKFYLLTLKAFQRDDISNQSKQYNDINRHILQIT